MKRLIFTALILILVVITGKNAQTENAVIDAELEKAILSVVPAGIDIDNYPEAKAELVEHVEACGLGVVEGAPKTAENHCHYRIKIDDVFLQKPLNKTGFIYDAEWPFENGVRWVHATQEELDSVPEKWDLAKYGEMIRITRQQCGDCWAQASRANLEQLLFTHEGVNEPLSTQTLISSCCNHGSCNGGYMSTPLWIVEHGLPLLTKDPYKGSNSRCKFNVSTMNWDYKLIQAPSIGSSINYSRAIKAKDRQGPKVRNVQAMMIKHKSSAVVTISAISQSGGIIKRCSNINSGGNHMQNVVGWYMDDGDLIARVQNSWGTDHGQNGYTHLRWECGEGRFNRGLGVSTRVGIYIVPLSCKNLADATTGPDTLFQHGKGVSIGKMAKKGQTCSWTPKKGLSDPHSCNPVANPSITTEYHLTAKTDCGESSAMVLVTPMKGELKLSGNKILTPWGVIQG